MDRPVRIGAAVVLALVIVGLVVRERDNIGDYFLQAGIPSLVLNLVTMGLGLITALIFRLNQRQAITISIESGTQNGTLAITIATVTLADTEFAIVAAIYSLIMFGTGAAVVFFGLRLAKGAKA